MRSRSGWSGSGYAGGHVVGVDGCLCDVGLLLPPEDGGKLLLSADVEEQREAVVLSILDSGATELLGDLAVGFLHVAVVGGLGIFYIALESLLLGVDCLDAGGALFVRSCGGKGLELLLERLNFVGLGVDRILLGLELLLNIGDGLLAFVGSDYTLLECDDRDFCRDGLWSDNGSGGSSCVSWSGCGCRSLGEEGGSCEAGGQGSSKDKGAVHAVFETPYKDPDSGDFGWVSPGAQRCWEGAAPSSARENTRG